MELLRILKEKMLLKMPKSGDYPLGFGGCGIHRRDEPNVAENCFYRPLATLVVNGRKYSTVGGTKFFLKEGDVLISVVDMPAQNYVVEANSKNPFLSIDLDLDKHIILQILSENPSLVSYADKDVTGVGAYKADEDLLDLFLRIYKLSETPDKVIYLSSLLLKEMHLRLILSPLGRYICRINAPGGNNFSKAINYIRNNYKKIIEIGELAKIAGLSQSAFHRNFKRITGMSLYNIKNTYVSTRLKCSCLSEMRLWKISRLKWDMEAPANFSENTKKHLAILLKKVSRKIFKVFL